MSTHNKISNINISINIIEPPQMSTPQMYKKPRAFKSANEEPPAGYHYEGQPAQMIDGKLTVRLRRDVEMELQCPTLTPSILSVEVR